MSLFLTRGSQNQRNSNPATEGLYLFVRLPRTSFCQVKRAELICRTNEKLTLMSVLRVGKKCTDTLLHPRSTLPAGPAAACPGQRVETLSLQVRADAGSFMFHCGPSTRLRGLDPRLFAVALLQENISNVCHQ